jgi:chaperone modulatory protein CbpM
MKTNNFLLRARLEAEELNAWIEAGWVVPLYDADAPFSDADVARAELIHDLKDDMGVNDEGVTVALDLLDQVHGLRGMLREILSALSAQPDALRRKIAADIRDVRSKRTSPLDENQSRRGKSA